MADLPDNVHQSLSPHSDESYSEGLVKNKKKSGTKPLVLTPKLSQLPSTATPHPPGQPRPPYYPHPSHYHQMYRMRYHPNMPHPQHMSPEMMYRLALSPQSSPIPCVRLNLVPRPFWGRRKWPRHNCWFTHLSISADELFKVHVVCYDKVQERNLATHSHTVYVYLCFQVKCSEGETVPNLQ